MKKQSSIEWLVEQFEKIVFYSEEAKEEIIDQAREMHKQEIIEFGKKCFYKGFEKCKTDDANCFTAWREEAPELLKYKSEQYENKN